jgi:ABC-2 type transport system permease protein
MITDITTILWKEMKELFQQRGKMRGGWLGLVFFIGVFGIFMPLQTGAEWLESPVSLIYWSWIPFLLVSSVIADTFAGERERHTLETLLASRLSDRAILFGKIAAAILYGWGLTMICALLSVISVNVAFYQGQLLFYSAQSSLAILAFSLLISGLATGLGVLISLRSPTVRQAQQTFSMVFFLFFVPIFALPLLPESWKIQAISFMAKTRLEILLILVGSCLLILDVALVFASIQRFRRDRLILD